jgi:hypothetical protein
VEAARLNFAPRDLQERLSTGQFAQNANGSDCNSARRLGFSPLYSLDRLAGEPIQNQ